MVETRNTDDLILSAFLRLAAERGLDGVTTREVAAEAGVNPVTLFRRFGDKTTMAVEAIRRYSPAATVNSLDPGVSPENAGDSLVASLLSLADLTGRHRRVPWMRMGMMQASQMPEVRAELSLILEAVYGYLRRALNQAAPALRPEVDHHATALQWMGLLMAARRLSHLKGEHEPQPDDLRQLFQAAIRPLLREV